MAICEECLNILADIYMTHSDTLFHSSVSKPDEAHGHISTCSACGRTWALALTTLSYEGDLIPANAVLEDENDYPALTELEAREAMEGL